MKKIFLIAVFIASNVLSGCAGTAFKWADARKINLGMTVPEVTQLMGSPNNVTARDGVLIYVWVYANGLSGTTRTMRVDFKDGKAISVPQIPDSFQD